MDGRTLATGLGIFSLGLGLMELLAPRKIGATLGVYHSDPLIRVYGAREVGAGLAILNCQRRGRNPRPWIWGRVAGDALDLATLGAAAKVPGSNKKAIATSTAAVAAVTALDVLCGVLLSSSNGHDGDDRSLLDDLTGDDED